MNIRRRIQPESISLQLAPIIDVILFLLTFFLLTWNLTRYETDINVKVPVVRENPGTTRSSSEIIVNIRKNGTIILNGKGIELLELKRRLAGIVSQYPGEPIPIILRADKDLSYKHIVAVINMCQNVGIWNIAFATAHIE